MASDPIYVLNYKHLPATMPVSFTLVVMLAQEVWDWPGWACGVSGTIVAILWFSWMFMVLKQTRRSPKWEDTRD